MAYLPGVPDVSVGAPGKSSAPSMSTPPHESVSSRGAGGHTHIAERAMSAGKGSHSEHVGTSIGRHGAGSSTITGGDPMMHAMGHYGKNPPKSLLAALGSQPGLAPTVHPGVAMIRGGRGAMKEHITMGALGPERGGAMGSPGAPTMAGRDTE